MTVYIVIQGEYDAILKVSAFDSQYKADQYYKELEAKGKNKFVGSYIERYTTEINDKA